MPNTDLLLDTSDDLLIVGGDLAVGESWEQEVSLLLRLNQGELKSAPLLGPNLITLVNSAVTKDSLERIVKLHLQADKKDFERIRENLQLRYK